MLGRGLAREGSGNPKGSNEKGEERPVLGRRVKEININISFLNCICQVLV